MKKITLLFLAIFFIANVFGQEKAVLLGTNIFPMIGNAGIGTTTPTNTLHIYKDATVGGWTGLTTANAGLRIQDSGYSMYFDGNSIITNGKFVFGTNANKGIAIGTNNLERLTIDENGKVGIGTTTPIKTLDVNGDVNFTGNLYKNGQLVDLSGSTAPDTSLLSETVENLIFENGIEHNAIGTEEDGDFVFYRNSVSTDNRSIIINDETGFVGIGGSDSRYNLYVSAASTPKFVVRSRSEGARLFAVTVNDDEEELYIASSSGTGGAYPMVFRMGVTEKMRLSRAGNLSIGTTKGTYKLNVKGTIGCGEVIVEDVTDWPDFVFEDDYQLMSLKDLENYIKEYKHLPEIPTTAEVEENGISVGEMNAKLLQKVEELTLYTIQQQEIIEALKENLEAQNKRIEKLENN